MMALGGDAGKMLGGGLPEEHLICAWVPTFKIGHGGEKDWKTVGETHANVSGRRS